MDDSFSLGQTPKKRHGRLAAPPRHAAPARQPAAPPTTRPPSHARKGSFEQSRLLLGGVGLVLAAVLVWGFLHFMSTSGKEAATQEGNAIGRSQDVQAQLTGTSAIQAVEGLYAEGGSFDAVTPQAMKAYEPTFVYTDGASTDPNTVSVQSGAQGVGLAVLSTSGRCLYAHVAAAAVTYGSGSTCTGAAALHATAPAWPTPA
jgi:hypothetical protein